MACGNQTGDIAIWNLYSKNKNTLPQRNRFKNFLVQFLY